MSDRISCPELLLYPQSVQHLLHLAQHTCLCLLQPGRLRSFEVAPDRTRAAVLGVVIPRLQGASDLLLCCRAWLQLDTWLHSQAWPQLEALQHLKTWLQWQTWLLVQAWLQARTWPLMQTWLLSQTWLPLQDCLHLRER